MMRKKAVLCFGFVLLAGCGANVGTNDRNTGGGGISPSEGHSTLVEGRATGTGRSAAQKGQGAVPGSGASDETNNAQSPSESNGGNPNFRQ